MTTPIVPQQFSSPLTGNEILTAYGANSSAIGVSGQNFLVTTSQIANLANTDGGVGLSIGGVATGSFSQATSTTLTAVTGLTANLVAGATYQIDIYLAVTNNNTGGIKLALGGTATATNVLIDTQVFNTTTLTGEVNITALATPLVNLAVAGTLVFITGSITVNAAGTLTLQAAQNTSNATPLTVANGSYLSLTRLS